MINIIIFCINTTIHSILTFTIRWRFQSNITFNSINVSKVSSLACTSPLKSEIGDGAMHDDSSTQLQCTAKSQMTHVRNTVEPAFVPPVTNQTDAFNAIFGSILTCATPDIPQWTCCLP